MSKSLEKLLNIKKITNTKINNVIRNNKLPITQECLELFLTDEKNIIFFQSNNDLLSIFNSNNIFPNINIFKNCIKTILLIQNNIRPENIQCVSCLITWCIEHNTDNIYTQDIFESLFNIIFYFTVFLTQNINQTFEMKLINKFIENGCIFNTKCLENVCNTSQNNLLIEKLSTKYNIVPNINCMYNIVQTEYKKEYYNNFDEIIFIHKYVNFDHKCFELLTNTNSIGIKDYYIPLLMKDIVQFTYDDYIATLKKRDIPLITQILQSFTSVDYKYFIDALDNGNFEIAKMIITKYDIKPTIQILKDLPVYVAKYCKESYIPINELLEKIYNIGIYPDEECIDIAKKYDEKLLFAYYYYLPNNLYKINYLYEILQSSEVTPYTEETYNKITQTIKPDQKCLEIFCKNKNYMPFTILQDLIEKHKLNLTTNLIEHICEKTDNHAYIRYLLDHGYTLNEQCIKNIFDTFEPDVIIIFGSLVEHNILYSVDHLQQLIISNDRNISDHHYGKTLPCVIMKLMKKNNMKINMDQLRRIASNKSISSAMLREFINNTE